MRRLGSLTICGSCASDGLGSVPSVIVPMTGSPFLQAFFVGLQNDCDVPDQKAIGKYHNRLAESGRTKELFDTFEAQLRKAGYALTDGPFQLEIIKGS